MTHKQDFDAWEKEQNVVHNDNVYLVQNSLSLAQELQYGLATSSSKNRKQLGIEALRLLNDHPNDVMHHQYALNVHHVYLNVHPRTSHDEGYTLKYGSMRIVGQVGLYGLNRFDDSGWLITLQLFDPIQITVSNDKDALPRKVPEPLKIPVAAIELPVIQVK